MKYVVLMPVYNAGVHLTEAIDSILNQSFTDFQLLIINDCSTDNSAETIRAYKDDRIMYVENETNLRLAKTLNKGLNIAKDATYIFRMDQDDISHPDRLKIQIKYLDENPAIGVVGAKLKIIGSDQIFDYPVGKEHVKTYLLVHNPLGHPVVAIRNEFLQKHQLRYREDIYTEDYDFWVRCSAYFAMDNIDSILLEYRRHEGQMTGKKSRIDADIKSGRAYQIKNYLNLALQQEQLDALDDCVKCSFQTEDDLRNALAAIKLISEQNRKKNHYDQDALDKVLGDCWASAIRQYRTKFYSKQLDLSAFKEYFLSSFSHYRKDTLRTRLGMIKRFIFP